MFYYLIWLRIITRFGRELQETTTLFILSKAVLPANLLVYLYLVYSSTSDKKRLKRAEAPYGKRSQGPFQYVSNVGAEPDWDSLFRQGGHDDHSVQVVLPVGLRIAANALGIDVRGGNAVALDEDIANAVGAADGEHQIGLVLARLPVGISVETDARRRVLAQVFSDVLECRLLLPCRQASQRLWSEHPPVAPKSLP